MIECFRIEEFIITEMFRPYMSTLLPGDFQGLEYCKEQEKIERRLRKNPEYIIELLEEYPETKRLIFERINRCDGVKFYRYLDMSCDVIQYIKSEMDRYKIPLVDMVKKIKKNDRSGNDGLQKST